ncbi:hypothetical protein IGI04_041846 [Brassica rapa subsp. trilocularis]|uniref:Homeobox domain-containing protein n=3 Tax=Brassica TaxID=3705 RepID=A0ABQ8BTV8_BRANA|nr:homeobox-leucine zipper protein HAT14 [Brassica rapa]XP_013715248.1 homeobox-leucine zipper protein HAT14 [Brassica napus]KAG5377250.1 hypothetical protein IGI04_041846 [Brassica rapa subsp. trilocularis]KAH0907793.1 hypothetical protein HID58_039620 [Brassica napus]
MELALCLGDNTNKFSFMEKPSKTNNNPSASSTSTSYKDLGFNMGLDVLGFGGHRSLSSSSSPSMEDEKNKNKRKLAPKEIDSDGFRVSSSVDPSLQLQLHFPWLPENSRQGGRMLSGATTFPEEEEEAALSMSVSPPDSVTSSFRLDFGIKSYGYERRNNKRGNENDEVERSTSRASNEDNDDDNGATRKKLRLSKDQSAFLEDSFKEHSTLNPKQKIALAKQLNLRPRQVEVWFQNRRARTKLKQTEVDCEYLKRCCESLTEENRRLQKEVKELRALKTSSPFCMQLPATTLTMCPSCERVATSVSQPSSTSAAHNIDLSKSSFHSPLIPVKPGPGKQV